MRVFSWNEIISDFASKCFSCGTALSVGSFDGPHLGHKMLFDALSSAAREKKAASCIVTFTFPLPTIKYPKDYSGDIATLKQRLFEFERLGIDFCVIAEFSEQFRAMDGAEFLRTLQRHLNMKFIAEGRDFHFGKKGEATINDIQAFCAKHKIECVFPDFVYFEGKRISSSEIRSKIKRGLFDDASRLLGREFELDLRGVPEKQTTNADVSADEKNCKRKRIYERAKITQVLPEGGAFSLLVNGTRKKVIISEKEVAVEDEGALRGEGNLQQVHSTQLPARLSPSL